MEIFYCQENYIYLSHEYLAQKCERALSYSLTRSAQTPRLSRLEKERGE